MPTQPRLAAALLTLAATVAACTSSGSATPPGATPSRTTSSPATSVPASNQMVMAISDWQRKHVTLYRVDQARRAHKLRTINVAAGYDDLVSVQMTSAAQPLTCLVHSGTTADYEDLLQTRCYPMADAGGYELPLGQNNLALARDGSRLLSLSGMGIGSAPPRRMTLSKLHDRTSTKVGDVAVPEETPEPCSVVGIAWAGDADVVIECVPRDDDPPHTVVQNLEALFAGQTPGTGNRLRPTGALAKGYDWFSDVTPLDANTAVGQMFFNIPCHESDSCPSHAPGPKTKVVRLDLHTGKVLEVVAVAAEGRLLGDVSGGSRGIVYETNDGASDKRVYVRWPGEKHGVRVTGVPTGFFEVVAQH